MIEIAGLIILGLLAQWLAWRLKVPAILPLILIGLLVGPLSTFITPDGSKFIDGDNIFNGEKIFDVISISVGLILFEGGLTLKVAELRNLGKTVRNLILFGTIICLIGGAMAAYYIIGMGVQASFLFGALIIVTGPTVIGPILRNVRPNQNINTILKWEGILIDPVGALVAILIYEFVISGRPNEQFTFFALKGFLLTIISGVVVGGIFAYLLFHLLKKDLIPGYLKNIIVLAFVMLAFVIADMAHEESGLLAVTLLGIILANLKIDDLKKILSFKEDVTLILISFLFVMLSSRIDIADIQLLLNMKSLLLFVVIVYLLRPVTIFLSTHKADLKLNEKIFLSYICPRGIVAAGVASIFSEKLSSLAPSDSNVMAFDAHLLMPLTFLIILGTVVIQGLTAKPIANLLGVTQKEPNGVLFLGANETARFMAKVLKAKGIPVLLSDTSKANINEAKSAWLPVYEGSILSESNIEDLDLSSYGHLYATTSNTEINILACRLFGNEFGKEKVFRLVSPREIQMVDLSKPKNLLFKGATDYMGLAQLFKRTQLVQTQKFDNKEQMDDFIEEQNGKIVPVFLEKPKNVLIPFTEKIKDIDKGDQIIYVKKHV
ncbi:cation:proton antiporter [Rapidithrix thailandica]|uniref:Cation:proton antiporter n=1 Tax=Rapidithrix thailandica TaxID=413964 RepID=A0AAW9RYD8_9BACT